MKLQKKFRQIQKHGGLFLHMFCPITNIYWKSTALLLMNLLLLFF